MSLMQKKLFSMGLRYALVALGAFIVGQGWIASDDWAALMPELFAALVTMGPAIYGAVKVKQREADVVQAAIEGPSYLTVEQVEQSIPAVGFRLPGANR